jgi:hypothetical protein
MPRRHGVFEALSGTIRPELTVTGCMWILESGKRSRFD